MSSDALVNGELLCLALKRVQAGYEAGQIGGSDGRTASEVGIEILKHLGRVLTPVIGLLLEGPSNDGVELGGHRGI